jgi:quercetin dioxygenase-like cupin family protein
MPSRIPCTIAAKETILATPEVRVTLMTLDPGQLIPPHWHTTVTDTTFCLAGLAELTLFDPDTHQDLTPGDRADVEPGRVHAVRNAGPRPCRLLLIQGVGAYDFLPR